MIYYIIRICISLFAFALLLTIKNRKAKKISLVLVMVLGAILFLIPVENSFLKFKTPEKAYYYNHTEKIRTVIDGEKSCMVVGKKQGTDLITIIPKSNFGYTMDFGFHNKNIKEIVKNEIVIYVYQYKNTSDYYISVCKTNGEKITISDNHSSDFYEVSNSVSSHSNYYYYSYIGILDDNYLITIDNEELQIKQVCNSSVIDD